MDVVNSGTPKLELNEEGDRFEVEERLLDVSGDTLGAVGTVFAYKAGDDKEAIHKRGEQIRAEMEKKIPSAGSLFQPAA
jgi:hypothetical protein